MGAVHRLNEDGSLGEVVFESTDPRAVGGRAAELSAQWHVDTGEPPEACAPYAIDGFDAVEIESGEPHEARDPETGALAPSEEAAAPRDADRVVVDEGSRTVVVHGDAEAPVPPEGFSVVDASGEPLDSPAAPEGQGAASALPPEVPPPNAAEPASEPAV